MRKISPPQYRPAVAMVMAIVMLLASLPMNLAQAAMVTTDQVIEDSTAADDRARVMDFMAREDVRQELKALGVDPDEASRRAVTLSDEEIWQIAGRLDELPAGQDWNTGILAGVVLLYILAILSLVAILYGVGWLVWKSVDSFSDSSSEKDQIDSAARDSGQSLIFARALPLAMARSQNE